MKPDPAARTIGKQRLRPDPHHAAACERVKEAVRRLREMGIVDAEGNRIRSSLGNLPRAVQEMDGIWIYDNTKVGELPTLLLDAVNGNIRFLIDDPPAWLVSALDRIF